MTFWSIHYIASIGIQKIVNIFPFNTVDSFRRFCYAGEYLESQSTALNLLIYEELFCKTTSKDFMQIV